MIEETGERKTSIKEGKEKKREQNKDQETEEKKIRKSEGIARKTTGIQNKGEKKEVIWKGKWTRNEDFC